MIAHMDEMPIWADMPSATNIDKRGIHTVPIKTTGHKNNRLIVFGCESGWNKNETLHCDPAKIVKKLMFIPGVIVAATPNGWMIEFLTSD